MSARVGYSGCGTIVGDSRKGPNSKQILGRTGVWTCLKLYSVNPCVLRVSRFSVSPLNFSAVASILTKHIVKDERFFGPASSYPADRTQFGRGVDAVSSSTNIL